MIRTDGKLLSKQWFDEIENFDRNGFCIVVLNNKWNLIDANGNFISKQWFDYVYKFDENGIAIVALNEKWNFIDTNGKLVSKQWFDSYDDAYDYLTKLQ